MTSSFARNTSIPRPTVKGAQHTWPGTTASRSHFEDFLREIGASSEASHFLCCIPRPSATPCAHTHLHKRSSSRIGPRDRLSSEADKARPSDRRFSSHVPLSTTSRPDTRGRTLSSPKVSGTLTTGLPISLKSPALSSIDLENHDASANYSYFSSARDSLLSCMGTVPIDERPSRAPTRNLHGHAPSRRSSDSSSASSPRHHHPSPTSSRAIPRSSEQRSRTRSSSARDRSASRTPSIDSLDTASSSEAPATPRTQSMFPHELPPTLEDLERTSRFRVQCVCMTCKRAGSNFPSCAKCGEMWCSRECRVGAAGTHACHGRSVSA